MFEMFFKSTARSSPSENSHRVTELDDLEILEDLRRTSTENTMGGWVACYFHHFSRSFGSFHFPWKILLTQEQRLVVLKLVAILEGAEERCLSFEIFGLLKLKATDFSIILRRPLWLLQQLAELDLPSLTEVATYLANHVFLGRQTWIGWLQRLQKERGVGLMLQGFAPWSWWIRFPWILSSLLGLVDKLEMSALKIIGLEGQMPLMPFSLNLKYLSILMPTITIYPCNPRNVGYFKAQSCGCRCHRCGTLLFDGCLRVTRCPSGLLPCRQGTSKNYEKNTGKLVWNSISARPKSIVQPWHCPVWVLLHISLILTYIHKYTPSIHQTFIWIHTVPHTCVLVDAYTTEGTFVVQHWEASWFFPHYTPSSINPALSPCFSSSLPWSFFDDLSWTWKIQFD